MPFRWAVFALLLAAAFCSSCRREQQAPAVDRTLARLIPPETTLLVGARLEQLRNTATYQKHFASMPFPALDRFARDTGIDVRRDVTDVLFASNGAEGVAIAKGRFNRSTFETRLKLQGAAPVQERGVTLWTHAGGAAAWLDERTAVAGSAAAVKSAVAQKQARGGGVPEALLPLARALPAESQFWAVFAGVAARLPVPDSSNLGNFNTVLRGVSQGRVAANLSAGFNLEASLTCVSDEEARRMTDSLKGLLALARATSLKRPELTRAIDTVKVEGRQAEIGIGIELPAELVDQVAGSFAQ